MQGKIRERDKLPGLPDDSGRGQARDREIGAAYVAAARAYLGTPWAHQQRVKGVGVDCVVLLICAARDLGFPARDIEGYHRTPVDCSLERELDDQLVRVDVPDAIAGDVLCFRWAGRPYHVGIVTETDELAIIHAWQEVGRVTENLVHAGWRRRIAGAWRLKA